MCLCPIHVRVRLNSPLPNKISVHDLANSDYKNRLLSQCSYTGFDYMQVPCGRCIECCQKRQSQHAFKLYQRIKNCTNVYHLTLTYSPETLPFAVTYNLVDRSTGEVYGLSKYNLIYDDDLLSECRSLVPRDVHKRLPLYICKYLDCLPGEFDYERLITPSLNRADVREALKVCRIVYKRKHKVNPNFKYSFCGEYGPQTNRPHYHIVFASDKDISDFIYQFKEYWSSKFGYVCLKHVRRINEDGSDGYAIASRYLSKYISKGEYECPSVVAGYAEKGRVCNSLNLDSDPIEVIKPYHLAYDLFGKYDFNSFLLEDGSKLTPFQIVSIVDEVRKRMLVSFGSAKISMPRYLKTRLFNYKDKNGYEKRSKLSYLVSSRVQEFYKERENSRFLRKIAESESVSVACSVSNSITESSSKNREAVLKKNYENFLQSSKSPY